MPSAEHFDGILSRIATPSRGRNEADLQSDLKELLIAGEFLGEAAASPIPRLEVPAGGAKRIDVEYAGVVFECKRELGTEGSRKLTDDEAQLAGYLRERPTLPDQIPSGILTDGRRWRHIRLDSSGVARLVREVQAPPPGQPTRNFREWLGSILATEERLAPSAEAVVTRIGAESPTHDLVVPILAGLLHSPNLPSEVALKRQLWAKSLRTAFGTQFTDDADLFVEHTYLVLIATLIAASVTKTDSAPLGDRLSGEALARSGITGVGEAGFFDWPLAFEEGRLAAADLARRLSCFSWSDVNRDVLKELYQSVIGPDTRHRLGEYYTPDWLAERIVAEVVTDPLHQRVLDPACGSGTFLFAAVRHYLEAANEAGCSTEDSLERLQSAIGGLDLHPVAVALAQVTYLLAVGEERLSHRPGGRFVVPVHLGDSMRWDQSGPSGETLDGGARNVSVLTADERELFAATLDFPFEVVGRGDFDSLINEMIRKATGRAAGSPVPNIESILAAYTSNPSTIGTLKATFATLCRLHDEGRDHIWGYFVRNQARPAWYVASPVDVLVGNPPWLAYRYMPARMQEVFRRLSDERNLWVGGKVATQQDLSAFFVARSVELYLRRDGRFAFVAPMAVLSRKAYGGFRSGNWTKTGPGTTRTQLNLFATLDKPWILEKVRPQPFPVPAAVVFGTKTDETSVGALGRNATHLSGRPPRLTATAAPIHAGAVQDKPASPYAARFRDGATLYPRMLALVERGANLPLQLHNQVSVRSLRGALEKPPWKSLPPLTGTVEGSTLRPVLLGESIVPFATPSPREAVIPYTKATGLMELDSSKLRDYPGFASWWEEANKRWQEHRGAKSKISLLERFDYYGNLAAQFPIPPLRVVYTKAGNTLAGAIVTDPDAIVDHMLYWAPVASLAEGRYLCAILNAPSYTERIRPYQSIGAFGSRHFDKYVWYPPVPLFDPGNRIHRILARLGASGERIAASVAQPPRGGFTAHRRAVRAALDAAGISRRADRAVGRLLGDTP
ncbi:MAG: N-6 DNA methylase [Actinomycetota bacterium]|nr:N-6 DNA methylase [Actinomycetota bacterium]